MGENKGIFDLKGKIAGLSFYRLNGKSVIRLTYGPDKKRIQNDPSFKRTRENNNEFGGASHIAKDFRMCFAKSCNVFGETYISARLTALMKRVNTESEGVKGMRKFEFSKHKQLLEGFEFDKQTLFSEIFKADISPVLFDEGRVKASLNIPKFNTDTLIKAPPGSSHFRLVLAGGVLSDYEYDTFMQIYKPLNPLFNRKGTIGESLAVPLAGQTEASISMETELFTAIQLPNDVVSIVCLGIQFYQEIRGEHYELHEGKAMKILAVG